MVEFWLMLGLIEVVIFVCLCRLFWNCLIRKFSCVYNFIWNLTAYSVNGFYVLFSLEICLHPSLPEFHWLFRSLLQHCLLVFVYCFYVYYIYPLCFSLQVVAVGQQLNLDRRLRQRQLQSLKLGCVCVCLNFIEWNRRDAENYYCRIKKKWGRVACSRERVENIVFTAVFLCVRGMLRFLVEFDYNW